MDWFTTAFDTAEMHSISSMTLRLSLAFACGFVISTINRFVRRRGKSTPTFAATLVLLCILCAMLPLIIGQNVAWAFGLVGTLSIIRFRTVIDDPQDITFVVFSVLVGMAVGADRLTVALVGIAVTGTAAFAMKPIRPTQRIRNLDARLNVRLVSGHDPDVILGPVFSGLLQRHELRTGGTGKQGSVLDLTFRVRMNPDTSPTDLLNQLNRIDAVQAVEIRRS